VIFRWRKIVISLVERMSRILSVNACLQQLLITTTIDKHETPMQLLEFHVLGLFLLQVGDVGVGVFPRIVHSNWRPGREMQSDVGVAECHQQPGA
jgi:hypothetical protein